MLIIIILLSYLVSIEWQVDVLEADCSTADTGSDGELCPSRVRQLQTDQSDLLTDRLR